MRIIDLGCNMINIFLTYLNNKYDVLKYIMMFIHVSNNNYKGTNKFNAFACFIFKKNFFRNLSQNLFYTTSIGMYGVIIIEHFEHLILG